MAILSLVFVDAEVVNGVIHGQRILDNILFEFLKTEIPQNLLWCSIL
jgi:hypothetical protein